MRDWSKILKKVDKSERDIQVDGDKNDKSAPLYFTGSRYYCSDRVNKKTDYDFFGEKPYVEYWAERLSQDGYEITMGEYFNKSFYAKKDDIVINLITVPHDDVILWALNTLITKFLVDKKFIASRAKNVYVAIFQTLTIILRTFKFDLNNDMINELTMITDMYPEIIELHDITNADITPPTDKYIPF